MSLRLPNNSACSQQVIKLLMGYKTTSSIAQIVVTSSSLKRKQDVPLEDFHISQIIKKIGLIAPVVV